MSKQVLAILYAIITVTLFLIVPKIAFNLNDIELCVYLLGALLFFQAYDRVDRL